MTLLFRLHFEIHYKMNNSCLFVNFPTKTLFFTRYCYACSQPSFYPIQSMSSPFFKITVQLFEWIIQLKFKFPHLVLYSSPGPFGSHTLAWPYVWSRSLSFSMFYLCKYLADCGWNNYLILFFMSLWQHSRSYINNPIPCLSQISHSFKSNSRRHPKISYRPLHYQIFSSYLRELNPTYHRPVRADFVFLSRLWPKGR